MTRAFFADHGPVVPIRAIAADEIARLSGRFEPEPVRKNPIRKTGFTSRTTSCSHGTSSIGMTLIRPDVASRMRQAANRTA